MHIAFLFEDFLKKSQTKENVVREHKNNGTLREICLSDVSLVFFYMTVGAGWTGTMQRTTLQCLHSTESLFAF